MAPGTCVEVHINGLRKGVAAPIGYEIGYHSRANLGAESCPLMNEAIICKHTKYCDRRQSLYSAHAWN